jgi:hypothetical protein
MNARALSATQLRTLRRASTSLATLFGTLAVVACGPGTSSGSGANQSGGESSFGGAGGPGAGGTTNTGGNLNGGGVPVDGSGATNAGGTPNTGGSPSVNDGGAPSAGGSVNSGGSPGASDAGAATCDPGHGTTWATECRTTAATTCVDGTWQDPGSTTNDPLTCQSAHFAVHSPVGTITAAQCTAATDTLENTIWPTLFGSPMFFPEPYCGKTTKYKASIVIHSDYGLTGGGWGSGYMGMWVGPGATADHWGLAHEFTHAVQSTTSGLNCGNGPNYCGWIYESHANWRAFQLPEYHTTNVHCSEMLDNAPHLYLGSTRDRYCDWQFMEYLKDKYCFQAVNDIWTSATPSSDPFDNIARTRGWSVSQLNDFFGEWAMHNVTWDYVDPSPQVTAGTNLGSVFRSSYGPVTDTTKVERRLRTTHLEVLDAATHRYVVPALQAPQRFGYNIVRLYPEAGATSVTVTFRGVVQAAANTDFRWGMVATDDGMTTPRYSDLVRGTDGALTFCVNAGEPLFLVVTGTPSVAAHIVWDQAYPTIYRYPYAIQITGAAPEGFQPNAPNPSATGSRWPNGGGWVANGANVQPGAYVGPLAAVISGTVSATARIEDHATILGGTVSSGSVGGLTQLGPNATVSGTGRVDLSWPYGVAWFESPQTITGTAAAIGDLELRGANTTKSSGTYCTFADGTTADNCSMPDVTTPPPYSYRP